MKAFLLFLALLPSLASAAVSGVTDGDTTLPGDLEEKLNTAFTGYYLAPSVDKVNTVLDIMNNPETLRKKPAWAPFVGFLTVVFRDNKNHVFSWMSRNDYSLYAEYVIVDALMHARLKESAMLFAKAHQWKKEDIDTLRYTVDMVDLKKLPVVLPSHIDTLWGAFFASGDPVYINEIIDVLFMTSLPPSQVDAPEGDVLGENKKLARATLIQYGHADRKVHDTLLKRLAREKDKEKRKALLQVLPDLDRQPDF